MLVKNKKLVIVGEGEFAEIAYEYFTHDSDYDVVGFVAEKAYLTKTRLYDLPVTAFEDMVKDYPPAEYHAFVAITSTKLNRIRTRLYQETKQKAYTCATYVSSHAFVWRNVVLGENTFIFENNVLQHHVQIGNNVIMWSGNHVGHRSVIEDHNFISSHVVIAGYARIGASCFLGINATINDYLIVAKDCFIASGALIVKNTEAGGLYKGSPAKRAEQSVYQQFNVEV